MAKRITFEGELQQSSEHVGSRICAVNCMWKNYIAWEMDERIVLPSRRPLQVQRCGE